MERPEFDFIKEYANWFKQNSAQRFVNGYTEVTTPFLDSHNDMIQFYVKRENNNFLFTDDGYTLADIEMNGLNLSTAKREELIDSLADSLNVKIIDGAITVEAPSPTLVPQTEHIMIQAILKFGDMFYLTSPHVRSLFLDDVKDFFNEHDVRFTPSVMFSGHSGLPQRFDFVIPASRMEPERVVSTINRPTKQNVQSAIFSWNDVKEHRKETVSYLIFNGQTKQNSSLVDAAKQYGMKAFWWDSRDEFIEQLTA